MKTILVVNAGSSSIKFQVFGVDASSDLNRQIRGQIDGIGVRPRLRASAADGSNLIDKWFDPDDVANAAAALHVVADWLRKQVNVIPTAVGHRVVHGGPAYDKPVLIDRTVLAELEKYVPLAPLHQPSNLAPIHSIHARFPDLPQVACFDTAFHRGHDALADHYAIPESLYDEGVRRYGFHGLSYEYIAGALPRVDPALAAARVIVAHLGSGASMCALARGRSVESTMGFTALDGLPMGTRPGQIDPGIVLYLIEQKGMRPGAVQDFLYRDCGLKGLSGVSNDVRDLLESTTPAAAFALDYFVYRVGLYAGMLAAALGGLDAFVFTAGIGENSAEIRTRIVEKLAWLGAVIDPSANGSGAAPLISQQRSRIGLYVVPTDEELMIARHTWTLVSASS